MTAEGWANWALVGNDAIYPHQVPFLLKEAHARVKKALEQALADRDTLWENATGMTLVQAMRKKEQT